MQKNFPLSSNSLTKSDFKRVFGSNYCQQIILQVDCSLIEIAVFEACSIVAQESLHYSATSEPQMYSAASNSPQQILDRELTQNWIDRHCLTLVRSFMRILAKFYYV